MRGLLIKDCYVVAKQLKIFLIIIPILALYTGGSLSIFATLLGATLPMTAIAYDERAKWNQLAMTMPYRNSELVLSKYLLGYIGILAAAALAALGITTSSILNISGSEFDYSMILISVISALLYTAIILPILIILGTEKGRFVFMGVMALIGASGTLFEKMNLTIPSIVNNSLLYLVIVVIIINILSIMFTSKVTQNRLNK